MLLAITLTLLAQTDGGLSRAPDGGLPPIGLACLPTWYAGTVKWQPDAGWGIQLDDRILAESAVTDVIAKPFTLEDVLAVVRRAAGRREAA